MFVLNHSGSETVYSQTFFFCIFSQIKKKKRANIITQDSLNRSADTVYSMCMPISFFLVFDTTVILLYNSLNVTSKGTLILK